MRVNPFARRKAKAEGTPEEASTTVVSAPTPPSPTAPPSNNVTPAATNEQQGQEELAAEIKRLEAEMERQRLENEVKQMEAALQQQQQPKPKVVRKVIKKRVVKKANGEVVTTIVNDDAATQPLALTRPTAPPAAATTTTKAERNATRQLFRPPAAPVAAAPNHGKPVHPLAAAFALGGGSALAPKAIVLEATSTGSGIKLSPDAPNSTQLSRPNPLAATTSSSDNISSGRPVHPLAMAFAKGGGSALAPPPTVVEATSTGGGHPENHQSAPLRATPPPESRPNPFRAASDGTGGRPVHPLAAAFAKGGGSALAPPPSIVEAMSTGNIHGASTPQRPAPPARTDCPPVHPLAAAFAKAGGGDGERPPVHPLAAAFAGATNAGGLKKISAATAATGKPSGNPLLAAIQGGVKLKSTNDSPAAPAATGNPLLAAIQGGVKLKSASSSSDASSPSPSRPSANPLMAAISGGVKLKSTTASEPPPPKPSANPLLAAIQAGVKLKPTAAREESAPAKQHANPLVAALSGGVKLKSRAPASASPPQPSCSNPLATAAMMGRANLKKRTPRETAPTPATQANPLMEAMAKRNALKSRSREPSPEKSSVENHVPFNSVVGVQLKSRAPPPAATTAGKSAPKGIDFRSGLKTRSREPSPERPAPTSNSFNPLADVQLKSRSFDPEKPEPQTSFNPLAGVKLISRSKPEPEPEQKPFNPTAGVQLKSRSIPPMPEKTSQPPFDLSAGVQLKSRAPPAPTDKTEGTTQRMDARSSLKTKSQESPMESQAISSVNPATTIQFKPQSHGQSATTSPSRQQHSVKYGSEATHCEANEPAVEPAAVKTTAAVVKETSAAPAAGPSEDEKARQIMEEIARVEAELVRRQQLEKEIKDMEAIMLAAAAAAQTKPVAKPVRKVVKRKVVKKKARAENMQAAKPDVAQSKVEGPSAATPAAVESEPEPTATHASLSQSSVNYLPPGWTAHEDPSSGMTYYANHTTGVTTWDRPEPVAIEQICVKASPMPKDEVQVEPEPEPELKVPSETESKSEDELPPEWAAHEDPNSGMTYYANLTTGETSWDRPGQVGSRDSAVLDGPESAVSTAEVQETVEVEPEHKMERESEISSDELPIGWTSHEDPNSGKTYYTNKTTGETTWDRPHLKTESAATDEGEPATAPREPQAEPEPAVDTEPESEASSDELPSGWSAHEDPSTGTTYYANQATGETTWDRPTPVNISRAEKETPVHVGSPDNEPTASLSSTAPNGKPVHPLAAAFALGGGSSLAPKPSIVESGALSGIDSTPTLAKLAPTVPSPSANEPSVQESNGFVPPHRPQSFLASIAQAAQGREERTQQPNEVVENTKEEEVADDLVTGEAYDEEEYYDENEGYYDEEGNWHWYENEGYYDEEGNWWWYPYEEEEVAGEPEPEQQPANRGDLLSSIAFAAKNREKRLEDTGGELIMQEFEPEVEAKKSGPPQLSFSLTEMVTKKAKEREARLEAGGEKKMTVIKDKEEYKKDFKDIVAEAAALGRLTRLNEHTIEAVAQEKTPEEEWKSQGLLAIQWRSNHMSVIHEAARAGAAFKLPEKVVSNFPEEEEDWDYEDEEYLTPRMQQLLDLTYEVGTGQHKVDKLVLGLKEENAGAESLAIKPMEYYQNIGDVKLPRPAPPTIDTEKHKKQLDEKARISKRPLSNISDLVAEKAWERRTRMDRPGALPRIKTFCECPYCINPTPYQTFAYREKARHAKTEAQMKEEAEQERQKLREQRRKKRDAVMAKRLQDAEKELQERNKQKSYASTQNKPARAPRARPPRVRPGGVPAASNSAATISDQNTASTTSPTSPAPNVAAKSTADDRRTMRQTRRAQRTVGGSPTATVSANTGSVSSPSSAPTRRPVRVPRPPTSTTTAIGPGPVTKSQPIRAIQPLPSKPAGPPATTGRPAARPARPPTTKTSPMKPAGTSITTTVVTRGKNGSTTKTTVVRRGPASSSAQPTKTVATPAPDASKNKGLFGGMLSGTKTTVKKRVVKK